MKIGVSNFDYWALCTLEALSLMKLSLWKALRDMPRTNKPLKLTKKNNTEIYEKMLHEFLRQKGITEPGLKLWSQYTPLQLVCGVRGHNACQYQH